MTIAPESWTSKTRANHSSAIERPRVTDREVFNRVRQRFQYLFNNEVYTSYVRQWKRIRDTQLPYTGEFLDFDEYREGQKRDRKIIDGEAWRACQIFAGGMASNAIPQSLQWFKLSYADRELEEDYAAKVNLETRTEILNRVINASNFYNVAHNCFTELAYGQAPMGMFEDSGKGVYFEQYPVGCYAYDVDDRGIVDTFAVRRRMSAYQLKQRFAEDCLPESVRVALNSGHGMKSSFYLCWLVEKNPDYDFNKLGAGNMLYGSYYWIYENNGGFIRTSGFNEFPIALARYQVIGFNAYGVGPGWYADSDARMLYELIKQALDNMTLFVRPPLQAPPDTEVDFKPGTVSRNNNTNGGKVETLFNMAPVFTQLFEVAASVQDKIDRAYSVNLFTMLDQQALKLTGRTAYELNLRNQEKLQQMGPVTERINNEFLSKVIDRVYNILDRHGIFPPFENLSEDYNGGEIKIEYISPLAQAQKMTGINNVEMLFSMIANTAKYNQEVLQYINWERFVRTYADKVGAPTGLLRSPDEIKDMRQAAGEKAAAAEQAQFNLADSKAKEQYTKAAANTLQLQKAGNPALDALLSGGAL